MQTRQKNAPLPNSPLLFQKSKNVFSLLPS